MSSGASSGGFCPVPHTRRDQVWLALGLAGGVGVSYLLPKLLKLLRNKPKNCMADLKQQGGEALDLLERHYERLASNKLPCVPDVHPGDIVRAFPDQPPEQGRTFSAILADVENILFPGLTHWQHPRFFAYYPANISTPAVLSELLIAGAGVVGLQWSASPAATELEVRVMDYLAGMIGVGGPFLHTSGQGGGIIQNTAGEAIACVLVAARCALHRQNMFGDREVLSEEERQSTFHADSSKLVYYCSDQTHFSGPKAARIAGMRCHKIPARWGTHDSVRNFGLQPDDLRAHIEEDLKAGLVPCALQLNYGTTNTSSNDPIGAFEDVARDFKLWVHVDAAYAGPSWLLPEFQPRTKDLERVATSFNFNGSKWFLCGFDSGFLWVNDRKKLKHVYAATGEYLAPNAGDGIYDPEFKDWAVPLGRRFRSLRVWMVINYFGVDGIRRHLRSCIQQADRLRAWLEAPGFRGDAVFEQPVPTELSLVVFRLQGPDRATSKLAQALLDGEDGKDNSICLYPSKVDGRRVIRVALGGVMTGDDEIELLMGRIRQITESAAFWEEVEREEAAGVPESTGGH